MKKPILKKKIKRKFFKATQGAISLMLCILITPFLSMAGALIELSRYQSATELMQEVIDSSMLSVLADYDEYLEDRFGLFAVSQDTDMSESFTSYLNSNSEILGGAVSVDSASLNGKFSLSAKGDSGDYDVLEAQVLDFSETSVITELVLENLKLQKLLDKLSDITGFSNITSIASNVKDATEAVKNLVESGETLYDDIVSVKNYINFALTGVEEIVDEFEGISNDLQTDLEFNINEYEIVYEGDSLFLKKIGSTDEADTIDIVSELNNSKYISHFNTIKEKIQEIQTHLSSAVALVKETLPSDLTTFKNNLSSASDAIENLGNIGSEVSTGTKADALQNSSEKSATDISAVFEHIIDEFETAIADVGTDLFDEISSSIDSIFSIFTDVSSAAQELLTFNSAEDNTELFNKIVNYLVTYAENGGELSIDSFFSYFLNNNSIRDLYDMIAGIPDKLYSAVEKAWNAIKDAVKDSVIKALQALMDAVGEMFNIELVDTDLNAYLSNSVVSGLDSDDNPYAKFLEGINELIEAVSNLSGGGDSEGSLWDKVVNFFKSLFDIFGAVETVLSSILDLVGTFIGKIAEFVDMIKNPTNLYDYFLVAGYMVHNFPNRLTELDTESALTGFSYSQLPADDISSTSEFNNGGLGALTNYLSTFDKSADGGNKVFKGAEAEYILAGTRSEIMNQAIVFMQIYMIRLLLNLATVFTDSAVASMASAANVFSWIVYIVILLAEPLCDTVLIVKGGEVDLVKSKCYLTPTGISDLVAAYAELSVSEVLTSTLNSVQGDLQNLENEATISSSDSAESGGFADDVFKFGYDDHLLLCMVLAVKKDQILIRFANLIQIEAKQYYSTHGGKPFDINKAYTCVTCDATVTYYPFISIFEAAGLSTFSVDYEQDRSY